MDLDDDLIVVDDVDPSPSYVPKSHSTPAASTSTLPASSRPQRAAARRRPSTPVFSDIVETTSTGRTTRSSHAKPRIAPKLKLKLSEKAASQAPGTSFLGAYDRELDSDDEELSFEEQFILRMTPGEDCERMKKMVASREIGPDVWFKFKDSRRAVFHIGNSTYSSKLVDLPCIIEAQKTIDNKQMFKVADICQMLLVENRVSSEDAVSGQKNFNIDDFIWQHGITPPLHHVRKRRFRKRVNKRTIESVEEEVERLLEQDQLVEQVKYDVLENVNPDLSDSEYLEREEPLDQTPGAEVGDGQTPAEGAGGEDEGEGTDEGDEPEVEGDIDEELAAELDLALGDEGAEEEEEEEEESEEEDEEDEDEDEEIVQARQLLNEEIADLEAAVQRKENEVDSAGNPLIKKRFEDALRKLRTDLDMKLAQKDEMREMARRRKEGVPEGEGEGGEDRDVDDEAEQDEEADAGQSGEGERRAEPPPPTGDMQMQIDEMQRQMAMEPPALVPPVLVPPALVGPQIVDTGAEDEGDLFGPEDDANAMDIG